MEGFLHVAGVAAGRDHLVVRRHLDVAEAVCLQMRDHRLHLLVGGREASLELGKRKVFPVVGAAWLLDFLEQLI